MSRFVYFIEAGEGGPIKIGVATDVAARVRDLQAANPVPLRLIVAVHGDIPDERRLHRQFKHERLNGEWFKANGDAREFALSLLGMSEPDRVVVVERFKKHKEPKHNTRRKKGDPFRDYTSEQLRKMFYVEDGDSVYRSSEAEALLVEREERFKRW